MSNINKINSEFLNFLFTIPPSYGKIVINIVKRKMHYDEFPFQKAFIRSSRHDAFCRSDAFGLGDGG